MAKAEPSETEATAEDAQVQQLIPGTTPDRDDELEKLIDRHEKAKAAVTKATDMKSAAYESLKEAMRRKGVEVYRCYRSRYVAELKPGDARVKTRAAKEDEVMPQGPAAA